MARKAKGQLPSGNIRIQKVVFVSPDGKRKFKSFTGRTRAEAEYLYSQWLLNRPEEKKRSLTLSEAVRRYIDGKENVLSPVTIVSYESILRRYVKDIHIGQLDIKDIDTQELQLWISDLSGRGLAPKTVRNAYMLIKSSIMLFNPDYKDTVTLPARKKPELYCPSDHDIKQLLSVITDKELEIAVLLAAFGPLRRSEICALESSDVRGNVVSVTKARVINKNNDWETKQPKTESSYRKVEMPDFVIQKMKGIKGKYIRCSPDALTARFAKALKASGCPHFRFHDLRHYSASIMHAIGVPDQYIMQRGGWATSSVMQRVYRNAIDAETERQTQHIKEHFARVVI